MKAQVYPGHFLSPFVKDGSECFAVLCFELQDFPTKTELIGQIAGTCGWAGTVPGEKVPRHVSEFGLPAIVSFGTYARTHHFLRYIEVRCSCHMASHLTSLLPCIPVTMMEQEEQEELLTS